MRGSVYAVGWSAWSPGLRTPVDWAEWALGRRALDSSGDTPPLEHVDAMFKRRFSQLTRMTIQVGHEALEGRSPMRIAFASVYGEIGQQFKITSKLIGENEVSPANFSLSVFNTPVAALTIAEKNTEGYVACYPGTGAFRLGFLESAAAVLSGSERERLFIVADEKLPEAYACLRAGPDVPYALALVLSASGGGNAVQIDLGEFERWSPADGSAPEALEFLRDKILRKGAGA